MLATWASGPPGQHGLDRLGRDGHLGSVEHLAQADDAVPGEGGDGFVVHERRTHGPNSMRNMLVANRQLGRLRR